MKKVKQNVFRYELYPKSERITLRLSAELLSAIKKKSRQLKIDYQKAIRIAIEEFLK